jgi:polar amino acid transport system substrate-binding protein
MKRALFAALVAALAAGALAAWSLAAPTAETQGAKKKKLPPLPAAIKQAHKWRIGVKCDTPPFGYVDLKGKNAGYDVEIAHWFSKFAFGNPNKVEFTCVTTASRIPALTSGKIDLIIATMTFTHARLQTVDFSTPYYVATGRLLVPNGSSLRVGSSLAGKTITTTGGSIYDRWLTKCFPQTQELLFQSPTLALAALKDGRADGEMFDDSFVLGVATSDPSLRLTPDRFLKLPWGIGIAKGDKKMAKWVNSRLAILKKQNEFLKILKKNVNPTLFGAFKNNVPGPKRTLHYPATEEAELACG